MDNEKQQGQQDQGQNRQGGQQDQQRQEVVSRTSSVVSPAATWMRNKKTNGSEPRERAELPEPPRQRGGPAVSPKIDI